ncbi:YjeJ family protein [Leclercia sp. S52]|uniref:YjeJ family protein n=1 Tax=Leclercia sp. S52 TaxID=3138178 RepID=UPI00321A80A4
MTIKVQGLNTASIKYNNRLALMMLKVKSDSNEIQNLYLSVNTLVDLLSILRHRMMITVQRLQDKGDIYKSQIQADSELMLQNTPEIKLEELEQPDLQDQIASLAPKFSDEHFTLIVMLQNNSVVTLHIEDTQVEFLLLALNQALNTSGDKETMQVIGSLLDFIMLYFVDLTNLEYLNYRHVEHEVWKQNLFLNHMLVLYVFETDKGKQIMAGTVLKTNITPGTAEIENLISRVASLTPGLQAIQQKFRVCQTFYRPVATAQEGVLSKEEYLRALHAFCLEMQPAVNA